MKIFGVLNSLVTLLFLLSLNVSAQNYIAGTYIGKETGQNLIIKQDGGFFLFNHERRDKVFQLDTMSFGSWRLEGDFIVLNTPKSINSSRLKVEVEEGYIPNSDSLVVEILNPYEDYYRNYGGRRLFDYVFSIDSYESNLGPEIYMQGNKISLYKTENNKIVNISIYIIPNCFLYPSSLAFNNLETYLYLFKNRSSNYIKVTIPQLTLEYIGYVRFKEEYVKITQNKLLLRGEVYIKR